MLPRSGLPGPYQPKSELRTSVTRWDQIQSSPAPIHIPGTIIGATFASEVRFGEKPRYGLCG